MFCAEREWLSWTNSLGDPQLGELVLPVGLGEEAALVTVFDELDQDRPVQLGLQSAHVPVFLTRFRCRRVRPVAM